MEVAVWIQIVSRSFWFVVAKLSCGLIKRESDLENVWRYLTAILRLCVALLEVTVQFGAQLNVGKTPRYLSKTKVRVRKPG
ncbi:hypothetical protein AG1IA_02828 [Rhizoctonia solani AG-1 IA]|uniref:Uncharacterized protein n=1 Tax=Thanatephorus cucumeris (strain AG1-IA) TaxID=983506 RepID=L8WYR3_THACA|nr:hypothetical protein AG1IA_02828 [Rhizoctonia solani AG-1 IA]